MIYPGDLRAFRNGRSSVTRDINWVLGLVLQFTEDYVFEEHVKLCTVLTSYGRIETFCAHGSRTIVSFEGDLK